LWMPPWQTALADQDRCHIGGFTVDDTGRTWVACAAQSDTADGWRSNRLGGGCLVGTDGRVLTEGLTLPRTPRAVGDQLLVANAGTGELLAVDLASGTTDVVAAWPEPCVALAVHKRWALVGLSAASGVDYEDLPVADRGAGPHASGAGADGLALVDLDSGRVVGTLHLDGRSLGVSSIAVLEGCRRPAVVVPRSAPARDMVVVGPPERLPVASGPSSEMPV
jgi:protein O-GlcNAc transferase